MQLIRRPAVGITTLALSLLAAAWSLAAPPGSREMTFIDPTAGYALVLQVEPAARDAGVFIFRAPGRGLYYGSAGPAMRVHSTTSVTLDYEGPATLGPQKGPDEEAVAPLSVTIRLIAQVDPQHRQAEATLWHGDSRFHLNTRRDGNPTIPRETLATFEGALLASDWTALYPLMNRDLRAAYTPAEFAAQGAAEVTRVGRLVGLRRVSVSAVQSNDDGARFVVIAYEAMIRPPSGSSSTTLYDAYFIREATEWRLWYSAER